MNQIKEEHIPPPCPSGVGLLCNLKCWRPIWQQILSLPAGYAEIPSRWKIAKSTNMEVPCTRSAMLQRWHLAKEQISHAPVLPPLLGSAMLWFLNNRIHSEILLALPFEEREIAPPKLEFVRLQSHQLLHKLKTRSSPPISLTAG